MAKTPQLPASVVERIEHELPRMSALTGAPLFATGALTLRAIVGCHAKSHNFRLAGSGEGDLYMSAMTLNRGGLARGMHPRAVWDGSAVRPWEGPIVWAAVGGALIVGGDERLPDRTVRRRRALLRGAEPVHTWDSFGDEREEIALTRRFAVRLPPNGAAAVHELESGKELRRLEGSSAFAYVAPEQDELTLGGSTLRTYDLGTGAVKREWTIPADLRVARAHVPLVVSPDAEWLCAATHKAAGSPDSGFDLTVIDANGAAIHQLPRFGDRHRPNLALMCGGTVLVGAAEKLLRVWSTESWALLGELDFTGRPPEALFGAPAAMSARTFAVSGNRGVVYVFDIEKTTSRAKAGGGEEARAMAAPKRSVKHGFPASFDKFRSTARTELAAAVGSGQVPSVRALGDGRLLLQYPSRAVFRWTPGQAEPEQLYDRPAIFSARADGVYAAWNDAASSVHVYHDATELRVIAPQIEGSFEGAILCGDDLLVISRKGEVDVFDVTTGERRGKLAGHTPYDDDLMTFEITCAADHENRRVVTCDVDTVRIWNLKTLACEHVVSIPNVTRLAVKRATPKFFVVGCEDEHTTLHVYAWGSVSRVARVPVHGYRMNVELLRDDTVMVVEELEQLALYDTATWSLVDKIPLKGAELQCVTGDGTGFVVVGAVRKRDFLVFTVK